MKKSSKIILLCAVCLLSLGIVLSVIGLFRGASLNRIIDSGLWNYTFYQEDDYDNDHSKDNTYRIETDRLDSLSIDWISGSVSVISYDGKDILLEESSEEKIDGENCLRYKLDENDLRIDFCREEMSVQFSSKDHESKALTVKIPKEMAKQIPELDLSSISADIFADGIAAEELTFSTTSGDFQAKALKSQNVAASTVSGNMNARFIDCPQQFCFDSTSGNCSMIIPQRSSLTVSYESVSGTFSDQFDGRRNDDGEYVIGQGKWNCNVTTVSGDLRISRFGI